MSTITQGLDRVEAVFDDGSLVADAGLLLAGTLMDRLGLEGLIDEAVTPPGAGRGAGAKVLPTVCSMLVGGSFFSDVDRLRAGSTGAVLAFAPVAPSTLGSFMRSFTWGHVRQLDRVTASATRRARLTKPVHHTTRIGWRLGPRSAERGPLDAQNAPLLPAGQQRQNRQPVDRQRSRRR
ncbi:hypothetical protein [Candidatus Poriferisodalis sp.]|uniref:hypothetical protein n=1 Tax=Candidatus Poriferisodalis sp. TaxID=3101277 RepID=UPI003B5B53B4